MNHYNNLSLKNITEYVDGIGWVTEEWCPVNGYDGIYEVSSFGRVKVLDRKCNTYKGPVLKKEKIRKQSLSKRGYCRVNLIKDGRQRVFGVHILVAIAFHQNPENKPEVNHIDTDKENNTFCNLEWNTRLENAQHASRMGCMNPPKGEKHPGTDLTNEQVMEIFTSKMKYKDLSAKYNISYKNVSQIKTGFNWSHVTGKKRAKRERMTSEAIEDILTSTRPQKETMMKYGISKKIIWKIRSGKSWNDINKYSHKIGQQ